jgi:hypothetical protein
MAAGGFLFAFKVFRDEHDCMESLVHCLTRSDLIHVEMVPVLAAYQDHILCAPEAHTAFVGQGYNKHATQACIEDPSFTHLFVPVQDPAQLQLGITFLESLHGKHYNYFALPLTILPESCKFRSCQRLPSCLSSKTVFCSQMGLMLCYLCGLLHPEVRCHGRLSIFDPTCCTPSDLYRLLVTHHPGARHFAPEQICVASTDAVGQSPHLLFPTIYDDCVCEAQEVVDHGQCEQPAHC